MRTQKTDLSCHPELIWKMNEHFVSKLLHTGGAMILMIHEKAGDRTNFVCLLLIIVLEEKKLGNPR